MEFKELLDRAKKGDVEAKEKLFLMFRPLLLNRAKIDGKFCEDLYQELCITFLHCLDTFQEERAFNAMKIEHFKD